MIYGGTNTVVIATTNNFATGLTGTIGVRIIDLSLNTVAARRTTGISEFAASGFYVALIDLSTLAPPPAPGHYFVFWDNGSVSPGNTAAEDLILHQTTTMAAALRVLAQGMTGHNAENISVGLFLP